MNVVITCGPAWEPIDRVRRITNFSTGRLGITLANTFARLGWDVVCFKGEQATCRDPLDASVHSVDFSTNDDLAAKLRAVAGNIRVDAVLHAAALCDYKVGEIRAEDGRPLECQKLPTREGPIQFRLVPATKILPQLRGLFPGARIIGWKYELDGSREDAFAAARRQLREAQSDGCVLNGAAYGAGFAWVTAVAPVIELGDAAALCDCLARWLRAALPEQASRAMRPVHG